MTRAALAAVFALSLTAPAFGQEKGRKVAFLVGVGDFRHDLTNLGVSPQKDATELGKVLKDGGFEVVVLTDKEATKAGIEERFKKVTEGKTSLAKGDLLMVAFCTHGFSLPPAAGQPDQPFLAAHDSKLDKPATMVSLNALIADGKSSGATVLYLIDACRETKADENRGQTRGIEPTQVTLPKGTAVLFSCGFGQVSHQNENAGGGHGLFTFAVLQTLRGERGIKDEVSWSGLVYEVEQAFKSKQFKEWIPPGKPQTPFASAGELAGTDLMRVSSLEADFRAYQAAHARGPATRMEYLQAVAPNRLAVWREQAEKGNTTAQMLYGVCFGVGVGVAKDEAVAAQWYRKSAEAGDPRGMNLLGVQYSNGVGVTKDQTESARWFRKSADAGDPQGMFYLGSAYEDGKGVTKDITEAVRWYRKSAELGFETAKKSLKRLGKD
jgi:hypothetical protein